MAIADLPVIGVSAQRIATFAKQLQRTEYWDAIAEGIIRIRDYLDENAAPIDYTRRRRLDYTDNLLSGERWDSVCRKAGIGVGYRRREDLARSWIYELLTGSPAQHGPFNDETWSYPFMYAYDEFLLLLDPALVADLRAEAQAYLAHNGIDEPLSWHPPMRLLHGLQLPGNDPAIASRKLLATHTKNCDSLAALSKRSDVPLDTLRYVLEVAGPQGKSKRSRYRPIVPVDEVRSLSTAGFNSRQIGEVLGFSTGAILRAADLAGFDIRRKPQKVRLDCDWLRHQVSDNKHCFAEIARSLGLHPNTVARHAAACGITPLTLGEHGCGYRQRRPSTIRAFAQVVPDGTTLEGWLIEQITVQRKAYTTIAAELGVDPRTVISLAREFAIPEPTLDTTPRGPTRPQRYSVQFRQRALTLLNSLIETQPTISNTRAVIAIAKQLGLAENTLRRWQCEDKID